MAVAKITAGIGTPCQFFLPHMSMKKLTWQALSLSAPMLFSRPSGDLVPAAWQTSPLSRSRSSLRKANCTGLTHRGAGPGPLLVGACFDSDVTLGGAGVAP